MGNRLMSGKIQILLIVVLGFILRLVALNQSLWLDEAIEWWGVTAFDLKKLLTGYMLGDFNPPGHHLLMWFWVRVFGDSEIALRMPSVLFGVGTVGMIWRIEIEIEKRQKASRLKRSDPANSQGRTFPYAAALATVNGLLIYYSQEARMYAMATFAVTASVWAFLKLQEKFSPKLFTVYCLLFTVALYSHYLAWLMVPVFVIGGVRKMGGVRLMGGMKYTTPLLTTIPLWPLLVKQLQSGIASAGNARWAMLSQTTPKNVALVFVKFVTGRVPFPDEPIWQLVVGAVVVLFWVGVVRGMRKMWGVREQKVIVMWFVVPLVLGGSIGLAIPVFSYFRFLFVLPAAILLFGKGVGRFRVFGGVGIVTFLSFSLLYLLFPSNHREDWRGAVREIHSQMTQMKKPVVSIHPAVRPPFNYYDRGRSAVVYTFTINEKTRASSSAISSLISSLWYIPYAQPIFDPTDSVREQLKTLDFSRTFERHFNGVTIEKWKRGRV